MNVLIAKTKEECSSWNGVAVILDVLRGSTTACALLQRGKKDVLLFADGEKASSFLRAHPEFEAFSDEELPVAHQDNSPYLADKSSARVPAALEAVAAGQAALCARSASAVLLGGFCNFYALAETIVSQSQDVLLIPAALVSATPEEEDVLCAEALKDFIQGVGTPERALGEFGNTVRFLEFRRQGPKTADKDIKLALSINKLPVVVQVSFGKSSDYGVCHVYGTSAPEEWMDTPSGDSASLPQAVSAPLPVQADETPESELSGEVSPSAQNPAVPSEPAPAEFPASRADAANKVKDFFNGVAHNTRQKAEALRKKASSAETEQKVEEAKSKLKGFFSNIVRSVKEEKEDLEQALFKKTSVSSPAHHVPVSTSEDPLDAILKESAQQEAPAASSTETPSGLSSSTSVAENSASAANTAEPSSAPKERDGVQSAPPEGTISFSGKAAAFGAKKKKKAIVLFSGGLDSTTCLYWAMRQEYECEALTVAYGQRHDREVLAAQMIARNLGVKHHLITLQLPWLVSSSLVDKKQQIPDVALEDIPKEGIPSTYVPGRNLMFLSVAGSLLDSIGADAIIAGPNAVDFSGYPDCTPAFFKAAADALNRGTKMGVTEGIEVLAPLMRLSKAEIVKLAAELKVPFELTWSCYAGGRKPCGHCDSCKLRAKGFQEAGVRDTSLD